MNTFLRDQVLRDALEAVRDAIEPGKKDPKAAARARDIAVKALYATREPDPLAIAAAELLAVGVELADELEAARRSATDGQMWACTHVPALLKAAKEAFRDARAAGVRLAGTSGGGSPPITPTGPI